MTLFNTFCYTLGWFWVVFLGIAGFSSLAVAGGLLLIFLQLYYARRQNLQLYIQDFYLVVCSLLLGPLMEIFFIYFGLIQYTSTFSFFPPFWIVTLYPLFALVLNHSLKWVMSKGWIAFLFGFIAPISYLAGQSLGGLKLASPLWLTWLAIAFGWGIFLYLMSRLVKGIKRAALGTIEEARSPTSLELLYDGECPLCKREICYLKRRPRLDNIEFVDIASTDYSAKDHHEIDYQKAMTQMHALSGEGKVLVGVPAFAATYARCQLFLLSTLFRLPYIENVLDKLYQLFAKYRLKITGRAHQDDK